MGFVVQWLWCVIGFAAGSAVAWAGVAVLIKRTSADEVPADAPPQTGAP